MVATTTQARALQPAQQSEMTFIQSCTKKLKDLANSIHYLVMNILGSILPCFFSKPAPATETLAVQLVNANSIVAAQQALQKQHGAPRALEVRRMQAIQIPAPQPRPVAAAPVREQPAAQEQPLVPVREQPLAPVREQPAAQEQPLVPVREQPAAQEQPLAPVREQPAAQEQPQQDLALAEKNGQDGIEALYTACEESVHSEEKDDVDSMMILYDLDPEDITNLVGSMEEVPNGVGDSCDQITTATRRKDHNSSDDIAENKAISSRMEETEPTHSDKAAAGGGLRRPLLDHVNAGLWSVLRALNTLEMREIPREAIDQLVVYGNESLAEFQRTNKLNEGEEISELDHSQLLPYQEIATNSFNCQVEIRESQPVRQAVVDLIRFSRRSKTLIRALLIDNMPELNKKSVFGLFIQPSFQPGGGQATLWFFNPYEPSFEKFVHLDYLNSFFNGECSVIFPKVTKKNSGNTTL